ncbi:MAG: pyridoxal phosphate-dependent aminotransferase, partial [Dehalococcoidia bacterium]
MSGAIHGGLRPSELIAAELRADQVLDFSISVSPIGAPDGVLKAISEIDLSAYPDPDSTALVSALSARLGVPPSHILPGNGATELIHLVTRVFVHQGQRPIVLAPTFGEYETATRLVGGHIYPWEAQPHRGFRWVLRNKPDVLRRVTPPLVFLCNPNNPTGVYVSRDEVTALSSALTGGPLLLDEAFVGFVDEPWSSLALVESGRVLVVRSMTKDYGLAGPRLGYLVAHPSAITAVKRLQPPWSVSSAAQAAGIAALADLHFL